jgi:hypothetical protein
VEVGVGGTGDAALGRAAMTGRLVLTFAAAAASCAFVSGCASSSIGAASGAAAGLATGVVTSNPAVGIGVGIVVQAATDEAVKRVMKSLHKDQQEAIAVTAGASTIGETRPWNVKHTLPVERNRPSSGGGIFSRFGSLMKKGGSTRAAFYIDEARNQDSTSSRLSISVWSLYEKISP